MNFKIQKKTNAENDKYLIECFEESFFIQDLLENDYSFVLGRKGMGKTALAKYLQKKYKEYGLHFSGRFTFSKYEDNAEQKLLFILIVTVQKLLETGSFTSKGITYWNDFLDANGFGSIKNHTTFVEWTKENGLEAGLQIPAKVGGSLKKEYERKKISNSASYLYSQLEDSLKPNNKIYIFLDDLSDLIDDINDTAITNKINTIREISEFLDRTNSSMKDKGKDLTFITCLRDDIFEYMSGSNINKLRNNSLKIFWTEETFCKLLIKRLPYYANNLNKYLDDPKSSILEMFPNSTFQDRVSEFETKKYATNFYAYMMAISFNRPRDFLKYCYALKKRISEKNPVEFKNLESAEIEYTDYLLHELQDELGISSSLRGFDSNINSIRELIYQLSQSKSFNYGQLRTEMSQYLDRKSNHSVVKEFINDLWIYGILGFKKNDSKSSLISFRYFENEGKSFLSESSIKDYIYSLHKGLKWAISKKTRFSKDN